MLPSMPVLFSRESQDGYGNKIEPSTSFFNQNLLSNPAILSEPPPPKVAVVKEHAAQKEPKSKGNIKKKQEPPSFDFNILEAALVKSYYTKVQSRFSANPSVPHNKFIEFKNVLKYFDPSKETPVDLYKRIEQLFGKENQDILEDFLMFLKPGQAAEVGRFMDHFMLVQMNGFIQLLHNTFYRKPTVLRKILRALTNAVNSGCCEEMKLRVLPHLRSNPRLIQIFKSLFPDERPPESAYETGCDSINESFLTADKGCDVWEFQEETDNKQKLNANETLDTMYLHGRVFLQHGRLVRSASVSYPYSKEPYRVQSRRLQPAHAPLSPPDSDHDSPKRTRNSKAKKPRKQLKSPTKNVKDVNDNTKVKECVLNSPKVKKKKMCKKEECRDKKDRKDSKSSCPKSDASKLKQPKMEMEVKVDMSSWTRDEDKTMLQVVKGEADTEQAFGRIRQLLPHRTVEEIRDRFCHVMTLLHQMAVGEVT